MNDLAKAPSGRKGTHSKCLPAVVMMVLLAIPAGCMRTISDPIKALRTDSASTGSIPPLSAMADLQSDEDIIAAAVAIARPDAPYPWSNSATGAAGVITDISAANADGRNCLSFRTSRHGFDGIALYSGLSCQGQDGNWHLETFDPVQG